MPEMNVDYPHSTLIQRHRSSLRISFLRFLSYIVFCFKHVSRDARVLMGHNAHGLIVAWMIATLFRRPYIYHCHDFIDGNAITSLNEKVIKKLEVIASKHASFVIVPDRARAEIIARELGLGSLPVVVANAPLQPPSQTRNLLKSELARRHKEFDRIVIRQGNVGPGHVLENVIRSMPLWASPRWGFVILGPVKETYRSYLLDLANEYGVSERVVLLPPVSYQDVKDFTVGADLGHGMYEPFDVNGANNTTASNKVFEYMAAGLPIILAENTENRKFVNTIGNGLTVDIESPAAIAQSINEILSDPEKIREMGHRSKRAFLEEYNYRVQYRPVIERLRVFLESSSSQEKPECSHLGSSQKGS